MDIDFEQIKKLREEIKEILKDNPKLQALQDEIDERLSKCNSVHNRCAVLQEMMLESQYRIVDAGEKLVDAYSKFTNPKIRAVEEEEMEECENCCSKIDEEDLIEVIHVDTRQTFFVCETCAEGQFFRRVL